MMIRLLSLVAGTALIASVSFAQAAEPRELGEVQMDSVTAGYTINVTGPGNYTITLAVASQQLAAWQTLLVTSGLATFDISKGLFTFTPQSTGQLTTSTLFTVQP